MDEKHIYNPTKEDFTVTYDINENQNPVAYTIPAREVKSFPILIANHIKKHLADKIVNERGLKGRAADLVYEEINKEIEVEL